MRRCAALFVIHAANGRRHVGATRSLASRHWRSRPPRKPRRSCRGCAACWSATGTIVLERYFNGARAAQPANIKSASKSVISALVGIAVSRGLIKSVDQTIADYFPELASDPEPKKRDITIEDLLTMRSGLESTSGRDYGAWVQSPNWVRFVLPRPLDRRAGHARRVQHRQLAPAVGDPDQGHQEEHVAVRAGGAGQAAGLLPRAVAAGSAGHLLRRQRDADDAAADDPLRRAVPERRPRRRSAADLRSRGSTERGCRRGRSRWGSDREYGYGFWIREFAGHDGYYAWGYGGQFIFIIPGTRPGRRHDVARRRRRASGATTSTASTAGRNARSCRCVAPVRNVPALDIVLMY